MTALESVGWRKRLHLRLRRFLPDDAFARQVAMVGGGTALVQAVGMAATPFLTRYYPPADFGVMAVFSAVADVLVLIATLKYDAAIPVVKEDRDAADLLAVCGVSVILTSTAVIVLLLTLPLSAFRVLSADERFFHYRWFLVVAVAGGGCYACLVGWATRRQQFGLLTSSKTVQSLSSVSAQLGIGALGGGIIGLVVGAVTNLTSGTWMLWRNVKRDLIPYRPLLDRRRLKEAAWRQRHYPVFTLGTTLVNLFSRSAPTLILSALAGSSATGLYGLGLRIVGIPATLISGAVSSVFLSRVAAARRSNTLGTVMEEVTARLVGVAACVFAVLACFGPELFSLVFGPRWAEAGLYGRLLSPWLFLMFVFSPQTPAVLARGLQAIDALWQLPILGLRLVALYVGHRTGGTVLAIGLFGAASAVTSAAYFWWVLAIGGASVRRVCRLLLVEAGLAGALVSLTRAVYLLSGRSTLVMLLGIAATTAVFVHRAASRWRETPEPGA